MTRTHAATPTSEHTMTRSRTSILAIAMLALAATIAGCDSNDTANAASPDAWRGTWDMTSVHPSQPNITLKLFSGGKGEYRARAPRQGIDRVFPIAWRVVDGDLRVHKQLNTGGASAARMMTLTKAGNSQADWIDGRSRGVARFNKR